ncbi:Rv3235 family protein [Clavibacter capsici]|uniref:Rv3235 family protein n=1 Tax=Clavibacter capsici TaxID=1874630 RepID=UPI00293E904B|nr:Rv3235 family protein [Clavibacter capsici]
MSEAVPQEELPDRGSAVTGSAEGASARRSGARKPASPAASAGIPTPGTSSRSSSPTATATVRGTVRKRFDVDDFFGRQPCSSQDLPPSGPLLENLTRCVIEILAGARELDQIARWVSDDVYRHLLKRVVLSARARRTKGQSVTRPVFTIGTVTSFSPRDGVIEAVIVVHGRARARAVAIRLEGLDRRWRATAVNVL